MPATITPNKTTARKPKTAVAKTKPAKGADKTPAGTPKVKAPKVKFVIPAKPTTNPTSLNEADYQYELPNGKLRFWQGYDAKFKKILMGVSRQLPQTVESEKARDILVAKGWSTTEREAEFVSRAQAAAQREVERVKAKAAKAAKATKTEEVAAEAA